VLASNPSALAFGHMEDEAEAGEGRRIMYTWVVASCECGPWGRWWAWPLGLDCPHWGLERDLRATSRSLFLFSSPQRRTGQEMEAWSSCTGMPHPEFVGGDCYADVARGPRSSVPSPTSHCSRLGHGEEEGGRRERPWRLG
jgi:hypothetical protein